MEEDNRRSLCRQRQAALKRLHKERSEEALWDAVIDFQHSTFFTASGLQFSYELKIGRDGSYNRELLVDRRKESKTLSWSSVALAFRHAMEMQEQTIHRPKALGDIRGISYIYPLLYRFGLIRVPEKSARKMTFGR
jgi:hypothetical protein